MGPMSNWKRAAVPAALVLALVVVLSVAYAGCVGGDEDGVGVGRVALDADYIHISDVASHKIAYGRVAGTTQIAACGWNSATARWEMVGTSDKITDDSYQIFITAWPSTENQTITYYTAAAPAKCYTGATTYVNVGGVAAEWIAQLFVNGGSGSDTITGIESGSNVSVFRISGLLGDNTITAGSQDSELLGGDGNDTLTGGSGEDYLHGGGDDDTLKGEGGSDFLVGGEGGDTVYGGAGDDYVVTSIDDGATEQYLWAMGVGDVVDGGGDTDDCRYVETATNCETPTRVVIDAAECQNVVYGRYQGIRGQPASPTDELWVCCWYNPSYSTFLGSSYALTYDGDATAVIRSARGGGVHVFPQVGVTVPCLRSGTYANIMGASPNWDSFLTVETVGGNDDITLLGNPPNTLFGVVRSGAGADHVYGGTGDDVMYGGADGDYLYGSTGEDVLDGDAGNDVLNGNGDLDYLFGGTENDSLSAGPVGTNDICDGQDGNTDTCACPVESNCEL